MNNNYILSLLITLVLLTSCKAPEPIIGTESNTETVIIDFNFGIEGTLDMGDALSYTSSKSESTSDIVAVQIYSISNNNTKDAVAYGLFDSYTSIEPIELIDGNKYIVEVSSITDGQDTVSQRSDGGGFYKPFLLSSYTSNYTTILNYFTYSSLYFTGLAKGETEIAISSSRRELYNHPFIERYYGCSEEFIASEDNSKIGVNLKRVYSILRFTCTNLQEGSIKLLIEGAPELEFTVADNDIEKDVSISLSGTELGDSSWSNDEYQEVLKYDLIHYSDLGIQTTLTSDGEITIYRNKIHPATIRVNVKNSLDISIEQDDMEIVGEVEL